MAGTVLSPGRREANRRFRHQAILDVAQASFLEHGYSGTSMSAIAAQLGGSKGTLWSYFPSKEALFTAVLDRATEEFRQQLTLVLDPEDMLETALRRFCMQYIARLTSPEGIALHRLAVGESSRFPEVGLIFYERAARQMHLLLAEFIAGAQSRGLLLGIEPLRAAQHLSWLCLSGHHQKRVTGVVEAVSPEELAEDVDAALTTFLRAYGPASA